MAFQAAFSLKLEPQTVAPLRCLWYGIRTKSNREKIVAAGLKQRGYEQYLPVYRRIRKWSDRMIELDELLFPGYVFCRFDATAQRLPIITTPGVASIVNLGSTPTPIPDDEIEAVQAALRSGLRTEPHRFIGEGQRVRIKCGPLEGVEGIFVKRRTSTWVVISVTMLQRSIAVEVDCESICPA